MPIDNENNPEFKYPKIDLLNKNSKIICEINFVTKEDISKPIANNNKNNDFPKTDENNKESYNSELRKSNCK